MTYRTVDSTFYGDPTVDASPVWNRVIDDALRLTDDDFMLVTWKHRYSRFKSPISPIPPYLKFDFLPSRMSYLVKDFSIADAETIFIDKPTGVSDFGNAHIIANAPGGTGYRDTRGFSAESDISISAFDPYNGFDVGARFDGSDLPGYGARNLHLNHLRIAGTRVMGAHFVNAKAITGTINIIDGWRVDPAGFSCVLEGPDLSSPSDNIVLTGHFGDVKLRNVVSATLIGGIGKMLVDGGYNIMCASHICEDAYNGITTTVLSWQPTTRIWRPNFTYPAAGVKGRAGRPKELALVAQRASVSHNIIPPEVMNRSSHRQ